MDHLPICFDVRGRKIIVVGGTTSAARKAEMALRSGADIVVFSSSLVADFEDLAQSDRFRHCDRAVTTADFEGCLFAYAAAEDTAIDQRTEDLARAAGVPLNVSASSERSDFIMPAILDRSPLVVAISSSGASPILARIIKARFETLVPASFGRLANFIGGFRDFVAERTSSGPERRHFWERIIEGPVADMVMSGDEEGARTELMAELDAATSHGAAPPLGEVYLVGAGPGDPDLLTFRALRLMQRADVVLYDRLIGERILNLVRRDAERIDVGKLPKKHVVPQDEISRRLVALAKEGRRVLRLKGGDPFIFGRGGEEIEALASQGIPFQVVPGITAAAGCAAYAGIPLTHRDHAQACVFVTGHGKDGRLDLDWKTLLQPRQTVAIYMGLSSLGLLTAEFIGHGADPDLPVAVIEKGTRKGQRVVTGTLGDIAGKVRDAAFEGPAMTIVGTVVQLHDELAWFLAEPSGGQLHQAASNAPVLPPD